MKFRVLYVMSQYLSSECLSCQLEVWLVKLNLFVYPSSQMYSNLYSTAASHMIPLSNNAVMFLSVHGALFVGIAVMVSDCFPSYSTSFRYTKCYTAYSYAWSWNASSCATQRMWGWQGQIWQNPITASLHTKPFPWLLTIKPATPGLHFLQILADKGIWWDLQIPKWDQVTST